DKYEEGEVMSQSMNAGQKVEKNTTITVTISSGAGNVSIPNVENMKESAAQNTLTDAGFKYSISYNYSDTVEQGVVISQTPGANASGKKGDTIALVVSRGKESVSVPNVVGKSKDQATSELQAAGLNVGNVTEAHDDNVAAGNVISQGVNAGQNVDKGSNVDLVISKGKQPNNYNISFTAPSGEKTPETEVDTGEVDAEGNPIKKKQGGDPITTYTFTAVSNNGTNLSSGQVAAGATFSFSVDNTSETISSVVVTFQPNGKTVNATVQKK
ncbi:MAG: PASTA domain-containing protein, partial [Lachnospiraceae bacterium]|nr:PASTA domain-containing protein [Lachnospiraceae bacterium]